MRDRILIIALLLLFTISACKERVKSKNETILSGVVVPSSSGAEIIVLKNGKEVKRTFIDPVNGSFHIKLEKGGVYDIKVVPQTIYAPLYLRNINIKENEINSLETITIPSLSERGIIYGRVIPKEASPLIKIYKKGKEISCVNASSEDGRFVISNLPYGSYDLEVISDKGYNRFLIKGISLKKELNRINIKILLLYKTEIEGVDWDKNVIIARGYSTPSETKKRETALKNCRNNLISIIKEIRLSPTRKIGDLGIPPNELEGFIKGFKIYSEKLLEDGRYEIKMIIPLNKLADFVKKYVK